MKETLAGRVGRIISGSANALVSAVENAAPEMVLEEIIRENKLSFDNGTTWSLNPLEFPASAQYKTKELTIVSTASNSLLAVYENSITGLGGIDSRRSTDYGLNWSDPIRVINEIYYESRPRIEKLANGNILLAYQNDKVEYTASFSQTDIYYKLSEDRGESWLPASRFTNYVGEDISLNISAFQNKVFITFATERYATSYSPGNPYQLVFGILQESVEKFTPPNIFNTSTPQELIDFDNKQFVFRALVADDIASSTRYRQVR